MNLIASAVGIKTTTPMIPHSITAVIDLHLRFSLCFEYARSSGENLHIVPLIININEILIVIYCYILNVILCV